MSKYEDVRIVTFKEDYSVPKVDKNGEPIKDQVIVYYKKGSKHAIHYKVVDKLKQRGAKMEIEKFDRQGYVAREKQKRYDRQEAKRK